MAMYLKRLIFSVVLVLSLFFLHYQCEAQFFYGGEDPSDIQWRQIETSYHRVVFPKGEEKLGEKYSESLRKVLSNKYYTRNLKLPRLDVLLHTQTLTSNAWVSWAPARMEIFTTPPQDLSAVSWPNYLALHESRHFVQINSLNTGFTRGLSYFFGQQAHGLVLGLHLPLWFIEGDAVWAESVFSHAGRLRDPFFFLQQNAQWSAGIHYSYDKSYFGSYRDFVPDRYVLGARLISNANLKYGDDIFYKGLDRAAHQPWRPQAFTHGFKKSTGITPSQHLKASQLKEYAYSIKNYNKSSIFKISEYTDFIPIGFIGNSILCIRQKLGDIDRLVVINSDGEQEIVFTPGYYLPESVSTYDSITLMIVKRPDVRWQHSASSNIGIFSHDKKKYSEIKTHQLLFSPDVSPDKIKIASVNIMKDGISALNIIDLSTNQILTTIDAPVDEIIECPRWQMNNQQIVFWLAGDKGKALAMADIKQKTIQQLTNYTFNPVYRLFGKGDTIFFSGAYCQKPQIMAYTLSSQKTYCLTRAQYGADYPVWDSQRKRLAYANYTLNGFRLKIIPSDSLLWEEVTGYWVKDNRHSLPCSDYTYTFSNEESSYTQAEITSYKKSSHLFNFHSYGPVSISPDDATVNPGFTLMSQNLLSTSIFRGGYEYLLQEETHQWFLNYQYRGFYPIISFDAFYKTNRHSINHDEFPQTNDETYPAQVLEMKFNLTCPWHWLKRLWQQNISLRMGLSSLWVDKYKDGPSIRLDDNFFTTNFEFLWSRIFKSTPQHIYPRWGQTFYALLRLAPMENSDKVQGIATEASIYTPAFGTHDGFKFYAGFENQSLKHYVFSHSISLPRGYTNLGYGSIFSSQLSWRTPLLYPDVNVGPFIYCKRIYGGLNTDFAHYNHQWYETAGLELTGIFHIVRLPMPVYFTIRSSYLFQEKSWHIDVVLRADFSF
ncbi:MAG: hypothetical protein STSR0006_07050 [Lentimicrobium sp.]